MQRGIYGFDYASFRVFISKLKLLLLHIGIYREKEERLF